MSDSPFPEPKLVCRNCGREDEHRFCSWLDVAVVVVSGLLAVAVAVWLVLLVWIRIVGVGA